MNHANMYINRNATKCRWKEMLVNHKWNDEMVKWNNGNEYVVK